MITLAEYEVVLRDGCYVAFAKQRPTCPTCGSFLMVRDSRKRLAKDSSGQIYIFRLRRLFCRSCNQLHLEIPDCLRPNKHYFSATIEGVKDGSIEYCSADNKTLYRWKKGK